MSNLTETYQCQSYYEDGVLYDYTCGKCDGLSDNQPIATEEDLEFLERGEISACCNASINDFGYCTDCKEHAA